MVGCSLRHRGEELLGQRHGLAGYVADRSTMGIPLLHPWANRLGAAQFELAGRKVDLDRAGTRLNRDANGLPIHGLLGAAPEWRVERHEPAVLAASFDFGGEPELVAAFPFPHRLELMASVEGTTLMVALTVAASEGAPVPISFGFHPYLRLPGAPRGEWRLEAPVGERLVLDERGLPTGEREPVAIEPGPLGDRTFDDAYAAPPLGEPFALSGGGRRLELAFGDGFPFAQVYVPPGDELVAIEPMTAPANALCDGGARVLAAGESYRAAFALTVA